MKSVLAIVATGALVVAAPAAAFSGASSFTGSQVAGTTNFQNDGMTMEYIPSGVSKEQWRKMKENEKKNKGKNLGKVGITTFESRSFNDWQKSGGKNLFPVDPNSVKSAKDIPYMQRRGGKADGSDLKKKSGGGSGGFSFFGGNKKPAAPTKTEPEPKKTNWWTL